jgi:hypothetical protein
MQRQYQLLKESGARMSFPTLFAAGTPEYNDADFNKAFQGASLTPQDIVALTGGDNAGVSAGEWAQLSPDIQQAILNDPGTFLRGQFGKTYGASPYDLEHRLGSKYVDASGNVVANDDTTYVDDFGKIRRGEWEVFANPNFGDKQWFADQIAANPLTKAGLNPDQWKTYTANGGGSGDLLSVGAEGGIKDYKNLKWVPGVGLVHPRSDYMQVTDQEANIAPSVIMGLATGGMGALAAPAMGAMGSAALTGAMSAANADVSGGDPWKAFAGSFLGAAASPYINSALPADLPKWASSAIKGGAGSLIGGAATGNVDLANILGSAAGAGIGSTVADYSGSPELGKLSGALTRYFANSGRKQPVFGAPRQTGARKITDQSGLPDSVRARLAELKGAA